MTFGIFNWFPHQSFSYVTRYSAPHDLSLIFKQNKSQEIDVKDKTFRTFYLKSQRPLNLKKNFKDLLCLSKMHSKYRLIGSKTHTIYLSMEYTKLTTLSHTLNQNFKDHFLDTFFCQMATMHFSGDRENFHYQNC